jgi:hypothetical protein
MLLVAIFTFGMASAQVKVSDSLIQKIDNKDAYIVMAKTMSPRMKSDAGDAIVKIGKSATPDLIKVLEDRNKGIIAHFILSEIWKAQWEEAICCNVSYDGNIEMVTINGLKISIENNELHAEAVDLKKNKADWKKLCEA